MSVLSPPATAVRREFDMSMGLSGSELLVGEEVHVAKLANSILQYTDYGLERVARLHSGLEAMGWSGKEGIGGKLYLTNYRLVFKSHAINRLTGRFSVFLPVVAYARDTSRFLVKRLEVGTDTQAYEFVVWGVPLLIARIEGMRADLSGARLRTALASAARSPELLADGLEKSDIVQRLLTDRALGAIGDIAQDPFSLATVVNLIELRNILGKEEDSQD